MASLQLCSKYIIHFDRAQPYWMKHNPEGNYRPFRQLSDNDTLLFDAKRHPYKPTEHQQQFDDFLDGMGEKWAEHGVS